MVSCFHSLNIIHPGSHSWHQGFPKNIGVNEENASLQMYASPSPCKLKQFCKVCLKKWAVILLIKIEHIYLNVLWAC